MRATEQILVIIVAKSSRERTKYETYFSQRMKKKGKTGMFTFTQSFQFVQRNNTMRVKRYVKNEI